ncbi:MAG: hypothetical protein J6J00_01330 [Treponema sp.]|nr:hypothetical protein [Treponema sp.]
MKKVFLLFVTLLLLLPAASGKSKKNTDKDSKPSSPVWMTDEGRLSMFPSEQYLSAFSFGGTPEASKNKASETISEYIKSHVTSSVNYSLRNDDYSLSQDSSVETDNILYSTEYTTPFYSDYHGMYCVVAYIDRSKAFNYVKPKLDAAARAFPDEYKAALELEDDFDKVMAINKARASLSQFYEVYDFARAVNPAASARYEQIDILAGESQSVLNQLKKNVTVSLTVDGDDDGRFAAALGALFSELGFTVSKNGKAKYECRAVVNLNSQNKTAQTYEIHPFYSIEVTGGDEVRFSCTRKLEKSTGFDQASAERRAKLELEKDIKEKLIEEF